MLTTDKSADLSGLLPVPAVHKTRRSNSLTVMSDAEKSLKSKRRLSCQQPPNTIMYTVSIIKSFLKSGLCFSVGHTEILSQTSSASCYQCQWRAESLKHREHYLGFDGCLASIFGYHGFEVKFECISISSTKTRNSILFSFFLAPKIA